jgi:hypothetical protein
MNLENNNYKLDKIIEKLKSIEKQQEFQYKENQIGFGILIFLNILVLSSIGAVASVIAPDLSNRLKYIFILLAFSPVLFVCYNSYKKYYKQTKDEITKLKAEGKELSSFDEFLKHFDYIKAIMFVLTVFIGLPLGAIWFIAFMIEKYFY